MSSVKFDIQEKEYRELTLKNCVIVTRANIVKHPFVKRNSKKFFTLQKNFILLKRFLSEYFVL